MLTSRQREGQKGENLSLNFLKSLGYKIIARNFRCRFGEVDIIAIENQTLIFVEVKTRSSLLFGQPYEAVNHKKLRSISKIAYYFRQINQKLPPLTRIDVISVILSQQQDVLKIEHLKDVAGYS